MVIHSIKSMRLRVRHLWLVLAAYVVLVYSVTAIVPAPKAVSLGFAVNSAENVTFLADLSWIDPNGQRQLEQQIFDAALQLIADASQLIVLDMFLFNDWQGPVSENHRALSSELTDALIAAKRRHDSIEVVVISDPINEVYGGLPSKHFDAMRAAGVDVVLTDLTELQDSNPLYSSLWRWLIRPFGNGEGAALPNPFGSGRVSVRSYLQLLNFKANHRKLVVADQPDGQWQALVSSANPHDGSSAHRNVALTFAGEAVFDLLYSESVLLQMSGEQALVERWPESVRNALQHRSRLEGRPLIDNALLPTQRGEARISIVSESRIEQAAHELLVSAEAGDQVDLLMFYLSDRDLIDSVIDAHQRGVEVRVLLDVNKDAFGREKGGVPNRPVGAELVNNGVSVRWCVTRGEQCHGKMLMHNNGTHGSLLLGSGNYTRRNLEDFNLETNVLFAANLDHAAMLAARMHFEAQWQNRDDRRYSADYAQFKNESWWLKLRYRFMEATGIGTF